MGPRLCRRGNVVAIGDPSLLCVASMGPRLCRRGNEQPHREFCQEIQLQWGHVFVDVEIVHLLSARGKQPGFNGATSL